MSPERQMLLTYEGILLQTPPKVQQYYKELSKELIDDMKGRMNASDDNIKIAVMGAYMQLIVNMIDELGED